MGDFSYASAWLEKYKVAQKQTTQKSKGVLKHLISKPKAKKHSNSDSVYLMLFFFFFFLVVKQMEESTMS